MEGELKVGATLSEAFDLYRENAGVLLPTAFWLFLVVGIVNGLADGDPGMLLITLVIGIIVATLYQGMVVGLIRDVRDGRRDTSIGGLMSGALPVLGSLIGVGILSALGIALGFVLLIVPGLFLITIWAVVAPVVVVERTGAIGAFGRSRELVRGSGWPVFGAVVVAGLIVAVGGLILGSIAVGISNGPFLRIVFGAIASTFTAPVTALVAAVLYFRLGEIEMRSRPEEFPDPEPEFRAD
jgi:hypothetical protein